MGILVELLYTAIYKEVIDIFQSIVNWVKSLFKKQPQTTSDEAELDNRFARNYNDPRGINLYSMAACKLAGIVVNESKATVVGSNKRAEALNNLLTLFIRNKWIDATADIAGNGGIVIIPNYVDGTIGEDVIPQNRVVVNKQHNGTWKDIVVIVDIQNVRDVEYYLLRNMTISNGIYSESYKATQGSLSGTEVSLDIIPSWANIVPMTPTGIGIVMDRLPIAFAKCPTSDRNMNFTKGVPITYGQDETINNIKTVLSDFMLEVKNKRAFVGIDEIILNNTYDSKGNFVKSEVPESGIFKMLSGVNSNDAFFQVFDPALRDSSYIQILDYWFKILERGIGVSEGFFTQPKAAAMTATEVKAKNYDTFVVQSAFRTVWENALTDLVYAYNMLMNYYGINPQGDYEVIFDWSFDLIENTDVAFNQQLQGQSIDAISAAEVRQWLKPTETLEESQKAVDAIKAANPDEEYMTKEVGY